MIQRFEHLGQGDQQELEYIVRSDLYRTRVQLDNCQDYDAVGSCLELCGGKLKIY